jgi:hypothetical protein
VRKFAVMSLCNLSVDEENQEKMAKLGSLQPLIALLSDTEEINQRYAAMGENKKPYIYCGPPEKSFYFFSVLALHYIKKHGYQIPTFLKAMSQDFMHNFDSPLIIIDDAAYSAAQLAGLLGNLFYYTYSIQNFI